MLAAIGQRRRRFTIKAEVTVEVTDEASLQHGALEQVEAVQFLPEASRSADEIRAATLDEISKDASAALARVTPVDHGVTWGQMVGGSVTLTP